MQFDGSRQGVMEVQSVGSVVPVTMHESVKGVGVHSEIFCI